MIFNDKKPFDPAKWPFFYGYWIVGCTTLGIILSAPGQTVGVSVYTDYLIANLEVSRFMLSTAYMLGTIGSSLVIARIGGLLDKWGSRPIAAFATVGLGLVLCMLSQIDRISNFVIRLSGLDYYLTITFSMLVIGFMLLRFFGQGVLTLASKTMLMEWFVHKRGRMNAFSGIFKSLTFSGAPMIFNALILRYNWRGSWIFLGLVIGVGGTLFILAFFREKPENCGLVPDGEVVKSANAQLSRAEVDWTLKEAKKTYSFWIYTLGLSFFALFNTALMFHIVSVFTTNGLSKESALSIFLPASVVAISLHFVVSWLSDYVVLKYFLVTLSLGIVISSIGVAMLPATAGIYLVIAGNGIGSGMFSTLSNVSFPRFFGRKHLGAINGYCMSFLVFFSAIGPFLFGWSYDVTSEYVYAIVLCGAVALLLSLMAFKADAPKRKE